MQLDFSNRHVVVTGGTGALGRAVVSRLLTAGAHCHVPVWQESELTGFAEADHERVELTVGVDLTDESEAQRFFGDLPPLWASLQIAGGFRMSPLTETSLSDWAHMLQMNATTCFLACREAVKRIRARDDDDGGRLVNVAARPVVVPQGGMCAYVASKAAVAGFSRALAEELKSERIWVNAVVPSIMDTPTNRRDMPNANFDPWPKVDEVAETVAFLASPDNRVTRGGLVPVFGLA